MPLRPRLKRLGVLGEACPPLLPRDVAVLVHVERAEQLADCLVLLPLAEQVNQQLGVLDRAAAVGVDLIENAVHLCGVEIL
jgi:hypothetical protein